MAMLLGRLLAVLILAQGSGPPPMAGEVVDDQGKPVADVPVVFYVPPNLSGEEYQAELGNLGGRTIEDVEDPRGEPRPGSGATNLRGYRSDFYAFLALGLKAQDAAASRRAMDEVLRSLDWLMRERPEQLQDRFSNLLPVIERIDPTLVPEVFWRYVASRPPSANPRTISVYSPTDLIEHLAWYDRDVAAALFESGPDRPHRGPRAGDLVLRIRGLVVVRPPRRGGSTREDLRGCRPEPDRRQDPRRRHARPLREAASANAVARLSGCLGRSRRDEIVKIGA